MPAASNFRFYDNRQKYLLFVHTFSEKQVVAARAAQELALLRPTPPALHLFDAGIGDGTVLARLMRSMHRCFPTVPFVVVGKEISIEDVRLVLEKTPDRFHEHPATVLVMTNLTYAEGPRLRPHPDRAADLVWNDVALDGTTAAEFEEQIGALAPWLAENWQARPSERGGLVYERPAVLVLSRSDQRFLLDAALPRPDRPARPYDLVLASQPFRTRAPLEFKAERVLAPLARALAPGGRLLIVQSRGGDPGQEILDRIWPGMEPFPHSATDLLAALEATLGDAAVEFAFGSVGGPGSDLRYEMQTLPGEIDGTIGTSTLMAAWNAAVYVGQIADATLDEVLGDRRYLDVTAEVLREHGGLWFADEAAVVSRRV